MALSHSEAYPCAGGRMSDGEIAVMWIIGPFTTKYVLEYNVHKIFILFDIGDIVFAHKGFHLQWESEDGFSQSKNASFSKGK